MKMSIGFDVSKATLDVAMFDGQKLDHLKVANTEKGFEEILHKTRENSLSETSITMEATGAYHQRAADYFYLKGFTVYVVNPLRVKRYSEMKMLRAKTDKVDSKIIAQYGFFEGGRPYRKKSEKSLKIQGLLKAIDDLCQMRAQNKNRLEALNQGSEEVKDIMVIFQRLNTQIESEIVQMENKIRELSQEVSIKTYQNLLTIPGVGKRIAPAMIGYFGRMEEFDTAKQLVSFLGINPSPKISGTSVRGRGMISRKGNRYLRKLLYMSALSACRYNISCKTLYERLIEKGKAKKIALVAVANKLARQIFAVSKYERRYDPNFSINC
jgi:transposase